MNLELKEGRRNYLHVKVEYVPNDHKYSWERQEIDEDRITGQITYMQYHDK